MYIIVLFSHPDKEKAQAVALLHNEKYFVICTKTFQGTILEILMINTPIQYMQLHIFFKIRSFHPLSENGISIQKQQEIETLWNLLPDNSVTF